MPEVESPAPAHSHCCPEKKTGSVRSLKVSVRRIPAWLAVGCLALAASGCHIGIRGPIHDPSGSAWLAVTSPFRAAGPAAPPSKQGQYAESLMAGQEEAPGVGSYILYGLVGFPRDAVAAVLEPAGYVVGAVGGVALNVVTLPFQMVYEGKYKPIRPMARACVMLPASPFFFASDLLCRSFTGDMNRYRWGVHPFPRADHRFFPNYQAILGPGEE